MTLASRSIVAPTPTSYSEAEPWVRYLDPNGADINDGLTPGTPWKSIARALQFTGKEIDKNVVLLLNGDFTGGGGAVLELEGVKTTRGGSLAILGNGFTSISGPVPVIGPVAPSPTDESVTRLRVPVPPGSIPPAAETMVVYLNDPINFFSYYAAVLDYDNAAGWVDVSTLSSLFPATVEFLVPASKANWAVRGCDGLSGSTPFGTPFVGASGPNIVIAGFDQDAFLGVQLDGCKGVGTLACTAIGGAGLTYIRNSRYCRIGVFGFPTITSAESNVRALLFNYGAPATTSEIAVGFVNHTLSMTRCSDFYVSGNVGNLTQTYSRAMYFERNSTGILGGYILQDVAGFSDVLNVHMRPSYWKKSTVENYSPYYHDTYGVDTYGFGVAVEAVACDVTLTQTFHCMSSFDLMHFIRCRIGSSGLFFWNITCSDGIQMWESELGGPDSTFGADWSSTPPFGAGVRTLLMHRSVATFLAISKTAGDINEMISMIQSKLLAVTADMGALDHGPAGIIRLVDDSSVVIGTFLGANANATGVAATIKGKSLLHDGGGGGAAGNLDLGGSGVIPYPGVTTDDLGAGVPELCLFKFGP